MRLKAEDYKLVIEVPDIELIVDSKNIDFTVSRFSDLTADVAHLVVWNLSEDDFLNIIQENSKINLFLKTSNTEKFLLFSGYINPEYTKRERSIINKTEDETGTSDIKTIFKLSNSLPVYKNYYINKDYREPVTSTQIIKDCADIMEAEIVELNSAIPIKTYTTYKSIGKPHSVIQKICSALNINVSIKSDVIYLSVPDPENYSGEIPLFNKLNSKSPQYISENEWNIMTDLVPNLKPNELIECSFENLEGIFCVKNVVSYGNNYNKSGVTNITIRT